MMHFYTIFMMIFVILKMIRHRTFNLHGLEIECNLFQRLSSLVEESDRMTPHDLVAKVKSMGHDLGMVVDLTNTPRYYSCNVSYSFVARGLYRSCSTS